MSSATRTRAAPAWPRACGRRSRRRKKRETRRLGWRAGWPADDHGKGFLDSVPVALPALTRALKLQERAASVGFDWSEAAPILDKIEEEIGELREAIAAGDAASVKDEFGDLLFALVNLGRHLGVDAETALAGTNEKFRSRFHHVERAVEASAAASKRRRWRRWKRSGRRRSRCRMTRS